MLSYQFRFIAPEGTTTEQPILQVRTVSSSDSFGGPPPRYSEWKTIKTVYNDEEFKKAKLP